MTRDVVIVVYATCPLMLFAHGAALAAGAMIVRSLTGADQRNGQGRDAH